MLTFHTYKKVESLLSGASAGDGDSNVLSTSMSVELHLTSTATTDDLGFPRRTNIHPGVDLTRGLLTATLLTALVAGGEVE